MTVGMPLMSTVFTLMMPAAIGCYWIWRTLLNMVKAPLMNKFYPIPRFTQEELDAAAKELIAKSKGKKKKVITIEVDEDDDSFSRGDCTPQALGQKGGASLPQAHRY